MQNQLGFRKSITELIACTNPRLSLSSRRVARRGQLGIPGETLREMTINFQLPDSDFQNYLHFATCFAFWT